jgi:nitroreductase
MHTPVSQVPLSVLFTEARTHKVWEPRDVSDELLAQVFNLAKWGPTSLNCTPARFVFVKSQEEGKTDPGIAWIQRCSSRIRPSYRNRRPRREVLRTPADAVSRIRCAPDVRVKSRPEQRDRAEKRIASGCLLHHCRARPRSRRRPDEWLRQRIG